MHIDERRSPSGRLSTRASAAASVSVRQQEASPLHLKCTGAVEGRKTCSTQRALAADDESLGVIHRHSSSCVITFGSRRFPVDGQVRPRDRLCRRCAVAAAAAAAATVQNKDVAVVATVDYLVFKPNATDQPPQPRILTRSESVRSPRPEGMPICCTYKRVDRQPPGDCRNRGGHSWE
jgi:hypothetical protein